ncbi:hypothetical protein [Plantactinospora sp. KBS50]|uniref:hypothetical protein n=1 Tax=Plantactinospora sp. KBS50 TaxID=2024580 RepID=UPI000BAAE472|nr:hypothetical protein [Plantactinospora sp. KBS50]ASW57292.1 hypothetical protein CIK06_28855 [Plantactinospora sp. KBS50]
MFRQERPTETGLLDPATARVQWVRTGRHILAPQWSPDGTRLLLTINDKESGSTAIGILTAADRQFRSYPVDAKEFRCTDYCFFTWSRDGSEVVFQQTDLGGTISEAVRHPRRGLSSSPRPTAIR